MPEERALEDARKQPDADPNEATRTAKATPAIAAAYTTRQRCKDVR
jgi:hypothetical protein